MRYSSFLLLPSWKLSLNGLKLLCEVTGLGNWKLKYRSDANNPSIFYALFADTSVWRSGVFQFVSLLYFWPN